jgi:hypothetical protein
MDFYEITKNAPPSFNLDFQRMSNVVADMMTRGTVTRASVKWGQDRNGIFRQVANNRPLIDVQNGAPAYLAEPSGTNLVADGEEPTSGDVTVTTNTYTISFFGAGQVVLSGVHSDTLNGTETEFTAVTVALSAGTLNYALSGDVRFLQIEQYPVRTSFMNTTRSEDAMTVTSATPVIGQQRGAMFVDASWLALWTESTHPTGLKLGVNSVGNRGIVLGVNSSGLRLNTRNAAGSSGINSSYTIGSRIKGYATFDYDGQDPNTTVTDGGQLWVNGSLIGSFDVRVPNTGESLDLISYRGSTSTVVGLAPARFNQTALWNDIPDIDGEEITTIM